LRRATRSKDWNLGTAQPWANRSVSGHRNERIIQPA